MFTLRDRSLNVVCILSLLATCAQVACGSTKQTAGGSTGGTSSGGTTTGGTTGSACTTGSCGATSHAPTFSPVSSGVMATPAGSGTAAAVPYVRFRDSHATANSPDTGTKKQFEFAGVDYDPCAFAWDHAQTSAGTFNYGLSPAASFNFFGIYLVNGTPGAPLAAGTYSTTATSGQYVVVTGSDNSATTNPSGAGYNIKNCSGTDYEAVTGGTITIDAVNATGVPTSGTFNLVTTNDNTGVSGGSIAGAFMVGSCGSASGAQPVATQPDANACTLRSATQ